jgi:hypothetical protein
LNTKCFPLISISEAKFPLLINPNYKWNTFLLFYQYSHCGSYSNFSCFELIYFLRYFNAQTLFDLLVM